MSRSPVKNPTPELSVGISERTRRLHRRFKLAIALVTLGIIGAMAASFEASRHLVASLPNTVTAAAIQSRDFVVRSVTGLEPSRAEIDALNKVKREQTAADTMRSVTRFYDGADPAMRALFDVAGMAPNNALIGVGRATNGFLLSSLVFDAADNGRAYRLKPNTASVWLRQLTLIDGPFALFLVPDTPEARSAAVAAGGVVDETSRQTTNSWGLRGPEPDPGASLRGIALGDSFMQGMFNDDENTPPLLLERYLRGATGGDVAVLNTGHIGYAPEQYFASLKEYGPRFKPHFVVVSVCPNDFGDGDAVIQGRGDDWDEAAYWIGEILQWCRTASIPCILVPAPLDRYILGVRKDAWYPGRIANLYTGSSFTYCDPFEYFMEAHIRAYRAGFTPGRSPLFNHQINDNHFSPEGAALWARVVGDRLLAVMPKATEDVTKDEPESVRD